MKTFVVGHIDWMDHELTLERIAATDWPAAVRKHSKFPFADKSCDREAILLDTLDGEGFKQACFDADCMMNWIEV